MAENRLTRRQALKVAGAVALGGLAVSSLGRMPNLAFAQEKPDEPWEKYIDHELEIELGSFYFQVSGQAKNADINLEAGKIYILSFKNADKDMGHNALFGKDPDMDNRNYKTLMIDGLYGIELDGGQSGEIVFRAPKDPGEWEMGCFVTGHYEAGMKTKIIVK